MKKRAMSVVPTRNVRTIGPERTRWARRSRGLEKPAQLGMAERGESDGRDDHRRGERLGPVLGRDGRELDRLPADVGAGGEQFLAHERVVARADEEGELGDLVAP